MKPTTRHHADTMPGPLDRLRKAIFFFSFSDPGLEQQFLIKQHRDHLAFNRMVILVGTVAVSGYYLMNFLLIPPGNTLLYAAPYWVSLSLLSLLFFMTFLDLPHHVFNSAALLCVTIVNTAPLISLNVYDYPDTLYVYTGCVILFITGLIFVRISFYYVVAFAAIYVLIFELLYFSLGLHPLAMTLNLHYIYAFAIGIGLVVSYYMEIRERTNFVRLRIIVEERMKLSRLKDARPDTGPKAPVSPGRSKTKK